MENSKDVFNLIKKYIHPRNYNLSTYSLILTNIIVIIFAIVQQWNLLYILWIYLGQNFIIGLFAFLKIISIRKFKTDGVKFNNIELKPTKSAKIKIGLFFLFHYGFFNLIYAVFLLFFSGLALYEKLGGITLNPFILVGHSDINFLLISWAIFFINHLFSFIYNYKNDIDSNKNLGKMMLFPYIRIFPLHLLLFIGGMFGSLIVSFLVLKTVADVLMHNIEHNQITSIYNPIKRNRNKQLN